jgi:Peptidoglycan-synthase activator LpoB
MSGMTSAIKSAAMVGVMAITVVGCAPPQRQPVDQLQEGNTGLQSKDVVSATDHMASDLLALPELNASDKQWTIVITGVQNNTADSHDFSYNVFSTRLKSKLFQLGHGRVTLIENKQQYHNIQNQELEQPAGEGGSQAAGVQPDYGLYITIDDMPNRATNYYIVTGSLTNLKTRVMVWQSAPPYEVQAAR